MREERKFCVLKKHLSRHFIFVHNSMRHAFSKYIFQHTFLSEFINITGEPECYSISFLYCLQLLFLVII